MLCGRHNVLDLLLVTFDESRRIARDRGDCFPVLRIRGLFGPSPGTDSDERDHASVYVSVDLHWSADCMERGKPTVGLRTPIPDRVGKIYSYF